MQVHQVIFDTSAVARLAGTAGQSVQSRVSGLLLHLSFDLGPRSKEVAAVFASDRRVIGVLVGNLDDGSPTFKALKADCDAVSHNAFLEPSA